MKKVFSIFLCLCTLLSVVALFSACQTQEVNTPPLDNENPVPVPETPTGTQVSETVVSVDLQEYALVRPSKVSTSCQQDVVDLSTTLRMLCSLQIRPVIDRETTPVQNGLLEILIGETQRAETVEAMSEIQGHGWIIRAYNGKIIIAGTTDFLTRNALEYFVGNYLTENTVEGTTITMHEKVLVSEVPVLALVEGGEGRYSIVYSQNVDDTTGSEFGNEYQGTGYDHPYDVSSNIKKLLINKTGVRASTIPLSRDSADTIANEIIVGNTLRPESLAIMADLQANEYSVVMRDGKVIISGWNKATLDKAYSVFDAMVQDSVCYDDENRACILIPAEMAIKGQMIDEKDFQFKTEFPKPQYDGLSLLDTEDVGESSMLFVYSGVGATRENYADYCAVLEASGYRLYGPETVWEGSSFRTYLNESAGITLQVDHMIYAHAEEQGIDLFETSIRIIASGTDKVSLPDAEILNSDRSWTKRVDPSITMLKLRYDTGNFGLAAIIMLEDGSFIVYDGGGAGETSAADDENHMYAVMEELHKKAFGVGPTANNPLHIRAWIITHEHWDHQMVFYNFCKEYGYQSQVRIDRLLYNPASNEETYNCYNPDSTIENSLLNGTIDKWIRGDDFKAIRVHTGQKFYLANAELEVLYTHENIHPQELEYFNNSSTVFRINLHTTNREIGQVAWDEHIANTETSIWLGDLERVGSKCLRAMYGDTLKADIVQVAHHGYNGCEKELYALIDPEIVLWPTDENSWIGQTKNPNASAWYNKVNYFIAHELSNVKMIIVSSYYNTTISLTVNGPDYDNLWDVLENKDIVTDIGEIGATAGRVIYRPE